MEKIWRTCIAAPDKPPDSIRTAEAAEILFEVVNPGMPHKRIVDTIFLIGRSYILVWMPCTHCTTRGDVTEGDNIY